MWGMAISMAIDNLTSAAELLTERLRAYSPLCREMLLEFYAASGDFTRRLTSVKANAKFSSPTAGPDDYFTVTSCLCQPPLCGFLAYILDILAS